ncbi:helix-turn-helix domain-containing protein [Halomonas sp. HL-93]|uniref:helix-turn-helix domain-containing protein n=1 Tax=Halomonas sp. HL-93 TaxID=1666906 RepID=UPI0006DAF674|nr:AraC family transcriptional regulator [Halomonas sp. HL-93]KPQ18960.1 MAG: Helix-turn-helix domain [Halomonas sp. HL-93]SBR48984.1 Helix-turn-helix domain-containing protein [Halomonas sp. HL-93]
MFNAMTRAEIWLQDTLEKPLSIDDLAQNLGYSASQVRRQFRHYFHTSPSAYREKRRLERAAVLLAFTPRNIAQIAISCGYQNHSSFSRAFQRHFQLSPRNYRQAIRYVLHQQIPSHGFTTRIERAPARQAVLMRLYKSPEHLQGLGDTTYHSHQLEGLQARLADSTPVVSLPDLLSEKIDALSDQTSHPVRTDIGLYLETLHNIKSIPLPAPYRRVNIATRYYASTYFHEFSQLSRALTNTLLELLHKPKNVYISGDAPMVLWQPDYLELRVPLTH